MYSDYCIEKVLVVEYISTNGKVEKIKMNQKREKKIIKFYNSCKKHVKTIHKKCVKHSYEKIIYENNTWTSEKYKEKHETSLKKLYPQIKDFIKIYKISVAWPCN